MSAHTVSEVEAELTPAASSPAQAPPVNEALNRRNKALFRFAISITVLNIVGHTLLGFEQPPYVPILSVLVSYLAALGFEAVDAWAHQRPTEYARGGKELFFFLLPAHIAALASAMLLYADNTSPYLFAVVAAAASKYVFRLRINGRMRHFLNPSNFGIALTLLVNPTVGFAPPYMFLNDIDQPYDWLLPAGILMAGTMLNAGLTRKIPLIMSWVGAYIAFALLRGAFAGDNTWEVLAMMTGVPFVLYTNYMITDPGTTPTTRHGQIIFGITLAAVYTVLILAGIAYAIFFALVLTCFMRGFAILAGRVRRTHATAGVSA